MMRCKFGVEFLVFILIGVILIQIIVLNVLCDRDMSWLMDEIRDIIWLL